MCSFHHVLHLQLLFGQIRLISGLEAPWPPSVLFTVAVVVIALLFLLCIFLYCFAPEMGLALWFFILDIVTFCKLRGICKCCPEPPQQPTSSSSSNNSTNNISPSAPMESPNNNNSGSRNRCPSIDVVVYRSGSEPPPPYEVIDIISPSRPLSEDGEPPPPYEAIVV